MPSPETVVMLLSYATLAGDGILLLFVLLLLAEAAGMKKRPCTFTILFDRHGLLLLFIIALVATSGSLYFSEGAGWIPCKLCWFQRVFMYPQVPLVGLALWRRDRGIAPSVLLFCLIGMCFSLWHYGEQVYYNLHPELITTCDPTGVSCVNSQILAFGYITIPMMALTAFALNALISFRLMRRSAA